MTSSVTSFPDRSPDNVNHLHKEKLRLRVGASASRDQRDADRGLNLPLYALLAKYTMWVFSIIIFLTVLKKNEESCEVNLKLKGA